MKSECFFKHDLNAGTLILKKKSSSYDFDLSFIILNLKNVQKIDFFILKRLKMK